MTAHTISCGRGDEKSDGNGACGKLAHGHNMDCTAPWAALQSRRAKVLCAGRSTSLTSTLGLSDHWQESAKDRGGVKSEITGQKTAEN